jgi:sigma-B regulation protein RsbU (phosphoserine phosphatase)
MPFPFLTDGGSISRLELPGVPLGLLEGTVYDELEFQMRPGDTLILTSDGATDALDANGDFYDVGRFTESIRRNAPMDASEFLRNLHLELRQFIGGAELSDDVTTIALRRKR